MSNSKKIILIIICIILFVSFSLNSKTVINSIRYSLNMCYNSVIPSLFPFFVLSEFFVSILSVTKLNPSVYLFICGLLTGFPNGTKNICNLYQENVISKENAVKLLYCTANASPAYIVTFIGISILQSKTIGYIILLSQMCCSIMCAFAFGAIKKQKITKISTIKITETACKSITGSVSSCLNVCGYIIFSGVIADVALKYNIPDLISRLLFFIPKKNFNAIIIGMIEITRGITIMKKSANDFIIAISFIVGFSGLSVIMQCISCATKSKLPVKPIIVGKITYSILMPIITYCLLKLIPIKFESVTNTFASSIFIIFILFLGFFLYIVFDKSYKKLYNK